MEGIIQSIKAAEEQAAEIKNAALEKAAENYAREYKDRFRIIELGNELNFARIEDMSPEEYAIVSATAYRGIKKGNPDAIVLSHGMSRSSGDWIYRYLTTLKEPVCDVISIHLYQEAGTPEQKKWDEASAPRFHPN